MAKSVLSAAVEGLRSVFLGMGLESEFRVKVCRHVALTCIIPQVQINGEIVA